MKHPDVALGAATIGLSTVTAGARLVAFDWAGTAVTDYSADAVAVRGRVEHLTRLGTDIAIVADTHIGRIDGQLLARPTGPGRLLVCTRGGADVFVIGVNGPSHLWSRAGLAPPTDKGDAISWLREAVYRPVDHRAMLLVGDEFGPINGMAGSDAPMLREAPPGAIIVSVGLEPDGVPAGVQHVPGGPARFLDVLDELIDALEGFPEPVSDDSWLITAIGFSPLHEGAIESRFAVVNGRYGTRASMEEGSLASAPACYAAGVYGRDATGPIPVPLASLPDWAHVEPRVGGRRASVQQGVLVAHERCLDLRQGLLVRTWHQRAGHELVVRSARFASLAERDVLGMRVMATSDASVSFSSLASEVSVTEPGGPLAVAMAISTSEESDALTRLAVVGVGEGVAPTDAVEHRLSVVVREGLPEAFARHRAAWIDRWEDADVRIDGDPMAQRALRFAAYHLIGAIDPEGDLGSVPARGLTGLGYGGHVFWDTEVFAFPFYLFTHPASARAVLAYRYRTLPHARARAATLGYSGALFAWESADTGEDTTPSSGALSNGARVPILTAAQELHISADVAWATWRYFEVTGDMEFLVEQGVELLVETARFWASRVREDAAGHFHIDAVMGPDEYHENVDDNAFTNVLARWNLDRAADGVELLARERPRESASLHRRIKLRSAELVRWRRIARGLVDGLQVGSNLYEQFAGYFALADCLASDIATPPFAADVVLSPDVVDASRLVKQADVVMFAHMLPEVVERDVAAANFHFYEPRTTHGSSLSPGIHSAVAARIGATEHALEFFRRCASIDLGDDTGNSAQGVHIAALGSLWQAATMGFGGVEACAEGIRVNPQLPTEWDRLRFVVRWRGTRIRVDATHDRLELALSGEASVGVAGRDCRRLVRGSYVALADSGGWGELDKMRDRDATETREPVPSVRD